MIRVLNIFMAVLNSHIILDGKCISVKMNKVYPDCNVV